MDVCVSLHPNASVWLSPSLHISFFLFLPSPTVSYGVVEGKNFLSSRILFMHLCSLLFFEYHSKKVCLRCFTLLEIESWDLVKWSECWPSVGDKQQLDS